MSDFRKVCPECNKTFQDDDALEILTECPDDGAVLTFDAVDPIVGTRLADRYLVEGFIGRGATSTVYRAKDCEKIPESGGSSQGSSNGKHFESGEVAVKVLHPHLSADVAVIKRLSQEAKSLREFKHKNVVQVLSLGMTKQGQPFLVMELVRGESLLDHMRRKGALDSKVFLNLCDQILDAVGAAHSRGILHRDLKPGNIMLSQNSELSDNFEVKLLDFGIAKIVPMQGDTFFRLTQTGEMMGSLLYMSPEQCMEHDWDLRGDIYSLGCVFYEALTARAPLIGRTAFETMNKHLSEMPPPLSAVRPDLKFLPGLEFVVMKMLEKNPQQRYQNAHDVQRDLKQVGDGKGEELASNLGTRKFAVNKVKKSDTDLGSPERKRSRQRILEIVIFSVLMLLWAIPLFAAFFFMPDALVSACLFGVLLPFLAAVSAMTIVRVGQLTGAGTSSLFSLLGGQNNLQLPQVEQAGSLLLGFEMNLFGGEGKRKIIEDYQRVLTVPLFFVGKAGTGKTHLMASLACSDTADKRRAQFIFSPDGKLADLVVRWIASHPQAASISHRVKLLDLMTKASADNLPDDFIERLVRETIDERRMLIIPGSNLSRCPRLFDDLLEKILRVGHPSALLSDAETKPVIYIDDIEACGITDIVAPILSDPAEKAIELVVSAKSLSIFSPEVISSISVCCSLGMFSVEGDDATHLCAAYSRHLPSSTPSPLYQERDKEFGESLTHNARKTFSHSMSCLTRRQFKFLSRVQGSSLELLLAPSFPEIRTTEVEWSIIETMQTGVSKFS